MTTPANQGLFRIPSAKVCPPGLELKSFQEEDIYTLLKIFGPRKGIYNGNPMGAGKTIETIAYLNYFTNDFLGERTLILGPSGSIGVWEATLEDWLMWPDRTLDNPVQVIRNSQDLPLPEKKIVICSLDLAIPAKTKKGGPRRDLIARELLRQKWDLMIVDEAHHLGSMDSLRSRLVLGSLYPTVFKAMFLSGSMYRNKIPQLWPVFRTIAPDLIPPYWHFVNRYCHVEYRDIPGKKLKNGEPMKGKVIVGEKSAEKSKELGALARAHFMVRRPKAEILSFLPKKLEQKVYIDCPEIDLERHKKAGEDFRDDIEAALEGKEVPAPLATAYLDLGLKKVGPAFSWIWELLKEADPKESMVVFCYHREVAALLAGTIAAVDEFVTPVSTGAVIMGGCSRRARKDMIERFQAGELRVLVSTYAGAESITLTRATYLIRVERAWSRDSNEQAVDRVHRIGQEKTTYIKDLLVKGTLDEIVYTGLKRKLREHKRMFG